MINRRQFISVCSALGMTAPGVAGSGSVRHSDGSVIVIGAGVAGMSVGYLLGQRNVPFQILEAGPSYGGRVQTDDDFVDFPIPLGGEWLHAEAGTLTKIVNDDSVDVSTTLARYRRDATCSVFRNGKLTTKSLGRYDDLKFVGATWLTFYCRYVLPSIGKRMQFDTQIVEVDYSGEKLMLTDSRGKSYSADAVVITVPPQIIKDRDVTFVPALPKRQQKAFADAYIWGGMKVFVEFRKAFYPTFLEIEGTNSRRGQKSFYDAAYGQNSAANVLGLFAVGDQAKPYQALRGNQLRDYLLAELDGIFNGQASRSYVRHISQNWNNEKFIRRAYFADGGDWRLPPRMRETLDGRIFFSRRFLHRWRRLGIGAHSGAICTGRCRWAASIGDLSDKSH